MNLTDKANVVIYRIRQRGLEVFLVNHELEAGIEQWQLPQSDAGAEKPILLIEEDRLIELDPITTHAGDIKQAYAVEGDWHDIPSLKSLIWEDVRFVKDRIKEFIPDMERKGAYFAVKDAIKKVMPDQYQFLKELKEIISDRNSLKDL